MKAKRVDCSDCMNFTWPHLNGNGMIKENAKCKLGKRVMFRMPKNRNVDFGYFRYCNDFKDEK